MLYIFCISLLVLIIFILTLRLIYYSLRMQMDEMTSIKNYRGFKKVFHKVVLENRKKHKKFSLAIIDIDEFRKYNFESYAFGDCVLKKFVAFIVQQLPDNAHFARFKFGDEFILILPSDLKTATELINSMQIKCKENIFVDEQNQRQFYIRFSYGAAIFEALDDSMESLLIKAEKELKKAKEIQLSKY